MSCAVQVSGGVTLLMLMPIHVQDERGIALLLTLMATVLLTALGGALITLTTAETAIASNYRNAVEAFYAAEAGIEYVVQELGTMPSWSPVLTGAVRSSFADGAQRPTRLDGLPLDLGEETASLQSESDAGARGGPNRRIWRLYAYGPITSLLPVGAIGTPTFVAVWVADDLSETDGNALIDGNETLTLHARAYGPSNSRKIVEATVARNALPGEAGAEDLPSRKTKVRWTSLRRAPWAAGPLVAGDSVGRRWRGVVSRLERRQDPVVSTGPPGAMCRDPAEWRIVVSVW